MKRCKYNRVANALYTPLSCSPDISVLDEQSPRVVLVGGDERSCLDITGDMHRQHPRHVAHVCTTTRPLNELSALSLSALVALPRAAGDDSCIFSDQCFHYFEPFQRVVHGSWPDPRVGSGSLQNLTDRVGSSRIGAGGFQNLMGRVRSS